MHHAGVGHYLMIDKEWERLGMRVGTDFITKQGIEQIKQHETELVWCTAGRPGQDQLGDGGEGSTSVLTGSERSNVPGSVMIQHLRSPRVSYWFSSMLYHPMFYEIQSVSARIPDCHCSVLAWCIAWIVTQAKQIPQDWEKPSLGKSNHLRVAGRVRYWQYLAEDTVKTKITCLQCQIWIKARVQKQNLSNSTNQTTELRHIVRFYQNFKQKKLESVFLKQDEVKW